MCARAVSLATYTTIITTPLYTTLSHSLTVCLRKLATRIFLVPAASATLLFRFPLQLISLRQTVSTLTASACASPAKRKKETMKGLRLFLPAAGIHRGRAERHLPYP